MLQARKWVGLCLAISLNASLIDGRLIGLVSDDCGASLVAASEPFNLSVPLGLKPLPNVEDNPPTEAKVDLGKQLFFDPRLSDDNSVSCASCHDPQKGWSNSDATAVGIRGQRGGRSAPTVINAVYQRFQFWDGRAGTLEEQALGPIANQAREQYGPGGPMRLELLEQRRRAEVRQSDQQRPLERRRGGFGQP